jgi:hypothetical protein
MPPRCSTTGCGSECLAAWAAVPLVFLASSGALVVPFLESMGLKLSSRIAWGNGPTVTTLIVSGAWLASILIGCFRKHESGLACFIDSFGIPGIFLAVIYAARL